MAWLLLGVLLWSAVHLFPAVAAPARGRVIGGMGEGPYKGVFSLLLITAIVLMVVGWKSSPWVSVYTPPAWGRTASLLLVFVGLLLFAASGVPTNVKRFIRHPQLLGMATWAFAHLLANGDGRSLLLFGGLGLWAILEILALNRRDGAWEKPEALPLTADLKPLVGAVVGYALLFFAHPYLAGVALG